MWSLAAQRLTQITPPAATPDELWQRVAAACSAVPKEHIQSLFESMPRRVAAWLEHRTTERNVWARYLMPSNTLQAHTEYVLVKSVGPKDLWVVAAEIMSEGDWRIFPSPPVPCLNSGDGDQWCRNLS
ncbi:uncharacterized protein TNCV_1789661 [Trichonephila clavipes]|nr:uncharacterized protein TNCV_1789661 [Trichonephila clavipes]